VSHLAGAGWCSTAYGVNAWFTTWVRIAGSEDPARDAPIVMNHWTGLVLHQLASPDPAFEPTAQLTALVTAVIRSGPHRHRHDRPAAARSGRISLEWAAGSALHMESGN
jgi:tetracycline repressor-like protein